MPRTPHVHLLTCFIAVFSFVPQSLIHPVLRAAVAYSQRSASAVIMVCRCPHGCLAPEMRQDGGSCKGRPRFSHQCRGMGHTTPPDSLNYHPSDAPTRMSVAAINVDAGARSRATNLVRTTFLRKFAALTSEALHVPDLISASEVQSTQYADDLLETMAGSYGGLHSRHGKNNNDVVLGLYDNTAWEADRNYEHGLYGRYQTLFLTNKHNRRVAHVSIHMRLKGTAQKESAYNAVRDCIERLRTQGPGAGVDDVVISGDWNLNPTRIVQEFDDIQPIFTLDHPHTTAAARRPRRADNVCVTDSVDMDRTRGYVLRTCTLFSHFPILANIVFDS
jgi:hypothetical protein